MTETDGASLILEQGYCNRCGYDLRALRSARCPECGLSFDPEDPGTYRRVRRRSDYWWLIGAFTAMVLVGARPVVLFAVGLHAVFFWWFRPFGTITTVPGILLAGWLLVSGVRSAVCDRSGFWPRPAVAVSMVISAMILLAYLAQMIALATGHANFVFPSKL